VSDVLVAAGIHALLNFAPQVINVPLGTAVHYVDFSIELQILMYHLNNGTGPWAVACCTRWASLASTPRAVRNVANR